MGIRTPFFGLIRALISRAVFLFRHYSRKRRTYFCILAFLVFLESLWTISGSTPATRILKGSGGSELTSVYKQRIYIAALHYNDEKLLRQHWIPSILDIVKHWEPGNVYVSIGESGSLDGTQDALKDLGYELEKLGIEQNIETSNRTHEDLVNHEPAENEPGWIQTPKGKLEMRRLPYLAAERNKAMEKLRELAFREHNPRTFDKVLWLNDIIFNTDQVTALINTRHGNYAATCSMDFSDPSPIFYDTFALRDNDGHAAISQRWPWFSSTESRNAVQSYSPVPVKSCWNGMVVFDAAPFYNDPPLKFRGIPDSLADKHLEGSECCLIHIDNPVARDKGVWINPNVRVSYNDAANALVNPKKGGWPTSYGKVVGIWGVRLRWGTGWLLRWNKERKVNKKLKEWEREEEGRFEAGRICLVDEMQILLANGWMHL